MSETTQAPPPTLTPENLDALAGELAALLNRYLEACLAAGLSQFEIQARLMTEIGKVLGIGQ